MAEEVIISIQLEKEAAEKSIDQYTSKITELTKANNDLKKSNNDLIKSGQENSKEYLENTRQMEINRQKIGEATSARKGLVQSILLEDDSIKGLRVRNAELIKQRDLLSTSTEDGRNAINNINQELDKNNETIQKNSSALEKQKLNIGNYKSALDGLVPGLGGMIDGLQGATKAALTFIATPLGAIIGAIGVAIAAVTAYFKGSEEGQNKWNKIMAVGSAIVEQFMNLLEDLGGAIVAAFENPKQAITEFWEFLKTNIVNRIVGLVELFPKLGQAIEQAFSGDFVGAAKTAADAVGKVGLGVENITDKIINMAKETARLVQQGIDNGARIADLNAKIDRDERELIVNRAKTALEVSKLREKALQQEGEARKKILLEAIALEEKLTKSEVDLAKTRRDLAVQEMEANGDDKEAKKAVAEAQAALIAAETTAFQNTLRFRKEIAAIDEQAEKERLARLARIHEAETSINELELENGITASKSVEERVSKEIALEQYKAQELLKNDQLLAEERELIVKESNAKILEIESKGNQDIIAEELALKEVRLQADTEAHQALLTSKQAELDAEIANNGITAELLIEQKELKIQQIDELSAYQLESEVARTTALLANDLLTETQRTTIVEKSQATQNQIIATAVAARTKAELDAEKKLNAEKQRLRNENTQGLNASLDAGVALAKEAFGANKAIAIAETVMNTVRGIVRAIADYPFPYSVIVSGIVGALGTLQTAKLAGITFARGGIAKTGGMLSGPSHASGGIPFTVGGQAGFEAEGGEAIINKRSSQMFRGELSAINQAGGGVAFARGGIFQTGNIVGTTTRAAAGQAEGQTGLRNSILSIMESMPPTVVSVIDINERQGEVSEITNKAVVI